MRNHPSVTLAVKLLLAPCFVVGASLVARRFGPRVGGLVAGLPVVAGPILLVYALEHGRTFAAGAASGTLLGLVSLVAFVVVYARLAARMPWSVSMLSGWVAFAAFTAVFSALSIPAGVALGLSAAALLLGHAALPRPALKPRVQGAPPRWDLPVRGACALVLVLGLTAIAGWLGPQLSGLLAPFPIISTVLATFTHTQRGSDELVRLLRGMVSGFGAFALFCFTLNVALPRLDTAASFLLASAVALLTQAVMLVLAAREPVAVALTDGPAG